MHVKRLLLALLFAGVTGSLQYAAAQTAYSMEIVGPAHADLNVAVTYNIVYKDQQGNVIPNSQIGYTESEWYNYGGGEPVFISKSVFSATIRWTALGQDELNCSVWGPDTYLETPSFYLQVTNYVPTPLISATNSGVINAGIPVTLSVYNYSYDTYTWLNSNGNPISGATGASYTTSQPGTYKVRVTKGSSTYVSEPKTVTTPSEVQNMNFVQSNKIKAPFIYDIINIDGLGAYANERTTQYFDGIGRIVQSVVKNASFSGRDVVQPIGYDAVGRESRKYLSYADGGDGLYKTNALKDPASTATDQQTLYRSGQQYAFYQTDPAFEHDAFPFSESFTDNSPLNKPMKEYGFGENWRTNDKAIVNDYLSNKDGTGPGQEKIYCWVLNSFGMPVRSNINYPDNTGYYSTGTLYIELTRDEEGNEVRKYTTLDGKMILKKVQAKKGAVNLNNATEWLQTYYIYDDYGNLRYVLQPKLVRRLLNNDSNGPDDLQLYELAFTYKYDERNRMIEKKLPSKSLPIAMVYDKRDRLVMSQDGNSTNKWLVTIYDELNRPVKTGIWQNTTTAADHRLAAMSSSAPVDYPSATSLTTGFELLSETHYDDYNNLPAGLSTSLQGNYSNALITYYNVAPEYAQPLTVTANVKGLVTWAKVKVLGTVDQFLPLVKLYDDRQRLLQVQKYNQTGGLDITTTQYNFAGKTLRAHVQSEIKTGSTSQLYSIANRFTYDHAGRVTKLEKSVNNSSTWKLISQTEYDELGQLTKKELGENPLSGSTPKDALETLTYEYNIRGLLLGINRKYLKDNSNSAYENHYFGFELGYERTTAANESTSYTNVQYNGNVAGMLWRSGGDQVRRKYDFTYDASNRLAQAIFNQNNSGSTWNRTEMDYSVHGVTINSTTGLYNDIKYDENGNLLEMAQHGFKIGQPVAIIDALVYSYYGESNGLRTVKDNANVPDSRLGDFRYSSTINKDLTTWNDYTYDNNGNVIADMNKGATITYNHLNRPLVVTTPKGTIAYTYDATGVKLAKTVTDNSITGKTITIITNYIDALELESRTTTNPGSQDPADYTNQLQTIAHEEGRMRPLRGANNTITTYVFDYYLKDHLGNIRMVLTEEQRFDKYPVASLEPAKLATEQNYYSINADYIVNAGTVSGMPAYINDNGIGNMPPDAAFEQANSTKLYRLNSTAAKMGLGVTLKVMAGDKLDIFARSYYNQNNTGGSGVNSSIPVLDLLAALLGSPGSAISGSVHGTVTASHLNAQAGTVNGIQALFTSQTTDNNQNTQKPKAYLNYLLFDEQFKCVGGNFSPAGSTQHHNDERMQNIEIPKNGYIYVYCSNQSPVNVYFDNLQVVHTRGPIVQEQVYYPFGLTMAAISSRAAGTLQNKNQYGGKELQEKEFSDGSGLDQYDFGSRFYDQQIGRWHTPDPMAGKWDSYSPYNYTLNNPIAYIDPNGEDVYLFYYVEYDDEEATAMFLQAAITRALDVLKSEEFKEGDVISISGVKDLGSLKKSIKDDVEKFSPVFGETREFGIWSHAGFDGPIGATTTSGAHALDYGQLSLSGWSKIDFNWAERGPAKAGFYGCNTGRDRIGFVAENSFTSRISTLPNFKDVFVWGQTNNTFPSMYTNVRETNVKMAWGNFEKQTVYMVAAPPLTNWDVITSTEAEPVRISRNGTSETQNVLGQPYYQPGKKKE